MTGPRVMYVLYYKTPPHTQELIDRAYAELLPLEGRIVLKGVRALGPPAATLNSVVNEYHDVVDWVVAWDPHFRFLNEGHKYVEEVLSQAPKRIGVVHFPGTVDGPQDHAKQYLAPYYGWGGNYRLLTAWRTKALRDIGGFVGVGDKGRNWIPATTLALERQGWQYHVANKDEPVVRHNDPSLTVDQWFMSKWWYARDWTTLLKQHRGNPYLPDDLLALNEMVDNMTDDQKDRLAWQTITGLRLLGCIDSKNKWPRRPLRKARSIELD